MRSSGRWRRRSRRRGTRRRPPSRNARPAACLAGGGAWRAGHAQRRWMEKLSSKNRWRVIDLLKERLVFERSSVRLYDTLLSRLVRASDPAFRSLVEAVQDHRNEEQEHAQWLEEQIRALGGDGHALSDLSILA